ncbi:MAG: 50S ribosomal protein L3 [Deltaproteobacteria bacterium]|nr:MAG: 50S ribosomal protein L3 [Deltaproteobacteria bacterium]PIE75288.1 MAG: 50S ribosomal protein L3 [Deltaproteobacteria bacterium]
MCKGLIGRKLGMTSIYTPEGVQVPVTVVEAGPCVITQVKTNETDNYNALQLAFAEKTRNVSKPMQGHFKKSGGKFFYKLKEFYVENPDEYEAGQEIRLDIFTVGEKVNVSGTSKGRGFSGTVRRHGFSRGPVTHGSRNVRRPGSVGCSAYPARIIKGKKMPGQYGNKRVTVKKLEIVEILPEENIIFLKGAVPGHKNGYLEIKKV